MRSGVTGIDVLLERDRHRVVGDRGGPARLAERHLQRRRQRERAVHQAARIAHRKRRVTRGRDHVRGGRSRVVLGHARRERAERGRGAQGQRQRRRHGAADGPAGRGRERQLRRDRRLHMTRGLRLERVRHPEQLGVVERLALQLQVDRLAVVVDPGREDHGRHARRRRLRVAPAEARLDRVVEMDVAELAGEDDRVDALGVHPGRELIAIRRPRGLEAGDLLGRHRARAGVRRSCCGTAAAAAGCG